MRALPSPAAIERRTIAIVTLVVSAASAPAGGLAVRAIFGPHEGSDVAHAVAVSTPLLTMLVVWHSLVRRASIAGVVARATVAGVLNVGAAVFVLGIARPHAPFGDGTVHDVVAIPMLATVASLFGSPLGGGLGFAFGVAIGALVHAVRDDVAIADLGAPARASAKCGGWLILLAIPLALAPGAHALTLRALTACTAIAMCALGTLATARRIHLATLLERGAIPGLAVVPRSTLGELPELPLFDRGVASERVLVRTAAFGAGPYRGATTRVPIALMPDPVPPPSRPAEQTRFFGNDSGHFGSE